VRLDEHGTPERQVSPLPPQITDLRQAEHDRLITAGALLAPAVS